MQKKKIQPDLGYRRGNKPQRGMTRIEISTFFVDSEMFSKKPRSLPHPTYIDQKLTSPSNIKPL